jgi:condensin complex subunit 3
MDEEAIGELLKTLIVAYFDPSTSSNASVRQTLSYFLPVYSYSRPENQARVGKIALDALHALRNVADSLEDDDEDEGEMVSLATIGAHLVDWTDPRKCYTPGKELSLEGESKKQVNGDVHLDLAADILERLNGSITSKFRAIYPKWSLAQC